MLSGLGGLALPKVSVKLGEEQVDLLLPCSEVEAMFRDPLLDELERTRLLRLRAWREVCKLFNLSYAQPVLKVVEGPLYLVHQNFIAGGAFSSLPMFLRFDGREFIAEFHRPVVAVNPYVYYFEGVASEWRHPVLLPALIHEYAHVAFALSGRLHLEFIRRASLDLRLAMQLPFLDDQDIKAIKEASIEVEALLEVPALWAEEEVCSRLGLTNFAERRLRLQALRDEELRRLMSKHNIAVKGPTAKVRVEAMIKHWRAVRKASLSEVESYLEEQLKEQLADTWSKLREEFGRGLKVKLRDEAVEAPAIMGRTVEWLRLWEYFLKREFKYNFLGNI